MPAIPLLVMNVDYDDNDARMIADWRTQAAEMLEAAGCHDVETHDKGWALGLDIHEMGGARMGKDPRRSVLNEWNQVHGCPNVFVRRRVHDVDREPESLYPLHGVDRARGEPRRG